MDSAIMTANRKQYYLTQEWQERDLYLHQLLATMDYNTGVSYALEKGEQKKAVEIARNLLAKGSSFEFVREITGLDVETIQGLSG